MAGVVDIVVRGEGSSSPLLIVEVKLGGTVGNAERQLRQYMSMTGVMLGLLVTEEQIFLLRDTYHPNAADSIERFGPFPTKAIESLRPPSQGWRASAFEACVQAWLESLKSEAVVDQTPEELKPLVEEWLAPAVWAGEVGAAGPRAA